MHGSIIKNSGKAVLYGQRFICQIWSKIWWTMHAYQLQRNHRKVQICIFWSWQLLTNKGFNFFASWLLEIFIFWSLAYIYIWKLLQTHYFLKSKMFSTLSFSFLFNQIIKALIMLKYNKEIVNLFWS